MDKRRVQEKEGHLKFTGLDLIPFDDRAANIVGADQKIRFGQDPQRTLPAEGTADIQPGIRTEVPGITLRFRFSHRETDSRPAPHMAP